MRSASRKLALLLALALAARAEEQPPLVLCLAPAADYAPSYPLKEVPATNREVVVVFRLKPGEKFETMTDIWTALDVGEAAPPNTEIARGNVPLRGSVSGNFRYSLPQDFPAGKYRLDALGDGKPWASLEFTVTPAAKVEPLAKPADLLPLEPGRTWTCSWLLETGPAVKKLTVAGAEQGADGKYRATSTYTVAGTEEGLTRIELRRGDQLVAEEWWSLTDAGLAVAKVKAGDVLSPHDPPLPMMALPLRSPHRWTHQPKGAPPMECRMWGPLPVATPSGEKPGWVVWMKTSDGRQVSTIERHIVPGVGVVREVHTDAVGPSLLTRIETAMLPPAK